ncbi:poly-gamma-glutamate hydrolase family protein [Lentzea sp. NBRC 105346]|uniref:poly-gamma-glutamate hydrolase family protein n=1 Tax=Lentzea sp. NBRC 105346 TaxID=3032205 RepID=UPI0025543AE9|nr:poly-gamma-glutamate hydrolase family protein [Lentzea sp. NBRC 105346]
MRPQPQWSAVDVYASNSDIYADPRMVERVDYRRRFKRHRPRTSATILAPHGGGIEFGTSELCLAIAGYHPATRVPIGQTYDYWMFEGLRSYANDLLHVTSSNCDDRVALEMVSESSHALGLHGCTAVAAGLPDYARAVLVGGRDAVLRGLLLTRLRRAGFQAIDAIDHPELGGYDRTNIANRTSRKRGAQLELTTPLRAAMFETNTRSERKTSTTAVFWDFVAATRCAIAATRPGRQQSQN